jgi:hypothetical protein
MVEFDKPVPSEGDTVELRNTENRSKYSGEVVNVERYHSDERSELDNAVYFEFYAEEDNKFMCKFGYYDGEEYSWVRASNYGGPEISKGEDCWEYEL